MFGMAEALWRPNMDADQLFECISQTLLTAFDRDATSGWGAIVHVLYSFSSSFLVFLATIWILT